MSTLKVDTILKRTGTGTITLGQSGDTIALGSGASATGFGEANTPAFSVQQGNNQSQSVSDATNTKVELDDEYFDTDSAFDTSTYRFTVPSGKAGKYFFTWSIFLYQDTVSNLQSAEAMLYLNGSKYVNDLKVYQNNYIRYGTQGGSAFTANAGTGANWAGIALPLVRKVFGQISSKEFVSVQPMNLPSGLVFFLDFQYGGTGDATNKTFTARFSMRKGVELKSFNRTD